MNKRVLWVSFLILLPVVAAGFATTVNSVSIFNSASEEAIYCSYFTLLPEGTFQVATPFAAICCIVSAILAITYAAGRKRVLLPIVKWLSFAAVLLAVLPIMMTTNGDIVIVPNVVLPILMAIEYFVAAIMQKKTDAMGYTKREPTRLPNR